jgi:hypothetical protein
MRNDDQGEENRKGEREGLGRRSKGERWYPWVGVSGRGRLLAWGAKEGMGMISADTMNWGIDCTFRINN